MPSFYERVMPQIPNWTRQLPRRELADAEWLVGVWQTGCHVYATPTTEEFDTPVTEERVTKVLNGHALKFATAETDQLSAHIAFLTVDPYDGAWLSIEIEPNVAYGMQRCERGWQDGALEFEGSFRIFNDAAVWRHRLVRLTDDEWRWENDERQEDGSWLPIDFHWYRRVA